MFTSTDELIQECDVMFSIDCRQLPQDCVLAQILRAQQLNDLDFEQIASLHGHLSKCSDDNPHLRLVVNATVYF